MVEMRILTNNLSQKNSVKLLRHFACHAKLAACSKFPVMMHQKDDAFIRHCFPLKMLRKLPVLLVPVPGLPWCRLLSHSPVLQGAACFTEAVLCLPAFGQTLPTGICQVTRERGGWVAAQLLFN